MEMIFDNLYFCLFLIVFKIRSYRMKVGLEKKVEEYGVCQLRFCGKLVLKLELKYCGLIFIVRVISVYYFVFNEYQLF